MSRIPVPLAQLSPYTPDRPDAVEAIWQPHYDFQTWVNTANQQTFFAQPVGQGGKTFSDTNMQLAGQFPSPTSFLVTAIMVVFIPAGAVSRVGTANAVNQNLIDATVFANAGYLEFTIGSKVYMRDAPSGKFPPNFGIGGLQGGALTNTTATTVNNQAIDYARAVGRYAEITPLLIPQNQNFNVTLNWPTALSTVTTSARLGVILDGYYYRQSQ